MEDVINFLEYFFTNPRKFEWYDYKPLKLDRYDNLGEVLGRKNVDIMLEFLAKHIKDVERQVCNAQKGIKDDSCKFLLQESREYVKVHEKVLENRLRVKKFLESQRDLAIEDKPVLPRLRRGYFKEGDGVMCYINNLIRNAQSFSFKHNWVYAKTAGRCG